jgi:tRNA A37 threonylcarbamoyladenosine dehydratase
MSDFETRFGGIGRLYGTSALDKLRQAHVCVVGIGGVGSWTVEALARSGVGRLTLVDLDEVCVTNTNRQVPAIDGAIGRPKVEVMAERAHAINPDCQVHAFAEFFTTANAHELLGEKSDTPGTVTNRFDCVVDAIDNVTNKCHLIASCHQRGIPVVTTGGAGGRRDPTAIRVSDLAFTSNDRLLQEVRKKLRQHHAFPRDSRTPFDVPCAYSTEPVVYPHSDGTICATREAGTELKLDCNSGYGTASFVTGTFGFAAAALAVQQIVGEVC